MTREAVQVHAYSGYRGEEEPRVLVMAGSRLEIDQVLRRWREPEGRYFEVLDRNGGRHVLCCREPELSWWRVGDPENAC